MPSNSSSKTPNSTKTTQKEVPAAVWVALPVLIAALVFGYFRFLSPGDLTAFAQCLTEKKAVFYGSSTCPHCAAQKRDFGKAFQYVKYVECNDNGNLAAVCKQEGIQGFPTWKFDGKDPTQGRQDLNILAQKTGCTLPEKGVVQEGSDIVRPDSTEQAEVTKVNPSTSTTPVTPANTPVQSPAASK